MYYCHSREGGNPEKWENSTFYEIVKSMRSFSRKIRKEKGCLDHSVYRDSEKENIYSVVGEWKTPQAMEKHFQTHDFELVIGAVRVLGETFEMNIAEVLKTGGFNAAINI